jgi:tryptophan-rich sensory protein
MKVPVEIRKYATIKMIILCIFSIGSIIMMMASVKRLEKPDFWGWAAIFFPVYTIFVLTPIEKVYAFQATARSSVMFG